MRAVLFGIAVLLAVGARAEDVPNPRVEARVGNRSAVQALKADPDYVSMNTQLAQYPGHYEGVTNQVAQYAKHRGQYDGLYSTATNATAATTGDTKTALKAIQAELDKVVTMLDDMAAGADKGAKCTDDVYDATRKLRKVIVSVVAIDEAR